MDSLSINYLIGRGSLSADRTLFPVNLVFDWCYTIMCVYIKYLRGTSIEGQALCLNETLSITGLSKLVCHHDFDGRHTLQIIQCIYLMLQHTPP